MGPYVLIAKTAFPLGLDGRLKAFCVSDNEQVGQGAKEIFFSLPGEALIEGYQAVDKKIRVGLIDISRSKRHLLIRLEGVESLTEAEKFRGASVFLHEKDLPKLEQGEFYLRDLVGKKVTNPEGQLVGVLVGYKESAMQGMLVIEDQEGDEVLVPVLPATIQGLDQDKLVLDFPEELLFLNKKNPS